MITLRIPYWLSIGKPSTSASGFKIEWRTSWVVYEFDSVTDLVVWSMWRIVDVGLVVGGSLLLWGMIT